MSIYPTTLHRQEAGVKVILTNHVQTLCQRLGWSKERFVGEMLIKANIGEVTSRRIWSGETNMRVETAAKIATLLGVEIGELIEIKTFPKK